MEELVISVLIITAKMVFTHTQLHTSIPDLHKLSKTFSHSYKIYHGAALSIIN